MATRKASQKRKIVVVGSSNTDLVVVCPQLPGPEATTVCGGEFFRFAGGKGANQAVAAARAGAAVAFVGAHGEDEFGATAKAGLAAEKIDTTCFTVKPGVPSGVALIMVGGKSRENRIAVATSANHALSPVDIDDAEDAIAAADMVVTQLEISMECVQHTAELARKHQVPLLLNPAPATKLSAKLLKLVHTLVPNEDEALAITGEKTIEKAAAKLIRQGCRNVVITLGAKGAYWATAEASGQIPAVKVKPVDTVGAGDCFNAWLAVGLTEKLDLVSAITRAIRAAGIAVTRPGAQAGMPWRQEVG